MLEKEIHFHFILEKFQFLSLFPNLLFKYCSLELNRKRNPILWWYKWYFDFTLIHPYLFSCYIQLLIYFDIGRHILKLKYFLHRKTYFRICFRVYFKNTIFVIFDTIISVKVFIIIGHKINKYLMILSK
jgi:hypothetical protein